MQGRHPEIKIVLSDEEKKTLLEITKSKKAEMRLVQRSRIILLAFENKYRNTEIGIKVGVNRDTVRHWIKNFNKGRLEGIKDKQRPGAPSRFSSEEKTNILAMATKDPQKEGRQFTDWSIRDLTDHIVEKKIVKKIGWSTVWRMLNKIDIRPHKWEYWLNSQDPHFKKN